MPSVSMLRVAGVSARVLDIGYAAVTQAPALIKAGNAARRRLVLQNNSPVDMHVGSSTAFGVGSGMRLAAGGGTLVIQMGGAIYALAEGTVAQSIVFLSEED